VRLPSSSSWYTFGLRPDIREIGFVVELFPGKKKTRGILGQYSAIFSDGLGYLGTIAYLEKVAPP